MLRFARSICVVTAVVAAGTLVACGSKSSTPTTPTPTPTPVAVTIAAPAVKSPVGAAQLDTLKPTLEVTNAVTNFSYVWRARATNGTVTSDWSKVETFKTKNTGFKNGQNVFDPLTDGTSVGAVHGGRFLPGQGWQSASLTDGIDYDIPTCSSCRVEFDVTNFGKKEGEPFSLDLKWFTMGDASTWGSFGAFRDHPWKMHLEQRSDAANGMKLIWRNGAAGGGDPGDHTQRRDDTESWDGGTVYHFVFDWTPTGLSVAVNGHVWFTDGFSRPYAPGNHRIELGCIPRGESFIGAVFRNFSVTPH
jgi:hypothetical protein